MDLSIEHLAYKRHLGEMLKAHEGHFVVIKDAVLEHFSRSYEEALDWGYEHFGIDGAFLVKKVAQDGDVVHFSHDIGPCRDIALALHTYGDPPFELPALEVVTRPLFNVALDGLIGRDVLRYLVFCLDGPRGSYRIEY